MPPNSKPLLSINNIRDLGPLLYNPKQAHDNKCCCNKCSTKKRYKKSPSSLGGGGPPPPPQFPLPGTTILKNHNNIFNDDPDDDPQGGRIRRQQPGLGRDLYNLGPRRERAIDRYRDAPGALPEQQPQFAAPAPPAEAPAPAAEAPAPAAAPAPAPAPAAAQAQAQAQSQSRARTSTQPKPNDLIGNLKLTLKKKDFGLKTPDAREEAKERAAMRKEDKQQAVVKEAEEAKERAAAEKKKEAEEKEAEEAKERAAMGKEDNKAGVATVVKSAAIEALNVQSAENALNDNVAASDVEGQRLKKSSNDFNPSSISTATPLLNKETGKYSVDIFDFLKRFNGDDIIVVPDDNVQVVGTVGAGESKEAKEGPVGAGESKEAEKGPGEAKEETKEGAKTKRGPGRPKKEIKITDIRERIKLLYNQINEEYEAIYGVPYARVISLNRVRTEISDATTLLDIEEKLKKELKAYKAEGEKKPSA